MPIVGATSGDANKIRIEAELLDNISAKLNVIDKEIDGLTAKRKARDAEAARASVAAAKSQGMAWTEFRSIYSTVLDVARVAGQVWQETGQEFIDYAEQVKNMSRTLGESAEETSRIIQVADDVRISYDTLKTSMKEAQKDGIQPNIEGLARLADQYNALQSPQEKTQFLLDRFGKSGLEMGKLMEKGGDGIRKMSGEIKSSLIVTEKGIKDSDDYQKSIDDLKDSFYAVQIEIGSNFVPKLKELSVQMNDNLEDYDKFRKANTDFSEFMNYPISTIIKWVTGMEDSEDATSSATAANYEAADSFEYIADSTKDTIDPVKELKDELDKLYAANKEALDFTLSYADFQMGYNKDHAEAVSKVTEAQQALNDKIAEGGSAKEIESATAALDDAKAGMQELEASWHESTQKMVYDMVLVKLEADGLTESEMRAAEDLAVTKGITTQEQIDQARMLRDEATAIFEGIKAQEDVKREDAKITADMQAAEAAKANQAVEGAAIDGGNTVVGMEQQKQNAINQTTAALMRQSSMYNVAGAGGGRPVRTNSLGGQSGGRSPDERDSGGIGVAGVPYIVNPIAAPEMFIPQTNGTFIPNADRKGLFGGGDKIYNVVINNPKVEASEDSIRNALKKMQYGVV